MSRQEDIYLGPRKHWEEKRGHRPWHRHLPWLLPLAACGVFLVLILGSLAVRQVILRRADGRTESPELQSVTGATSSNPGQKKDPTRVSSAVPPRLGEDPDLEVLPPPSAKQPGRTLPKMLVVGPGPEMFHSVEDAVSVAIPGDIVEICTNQPMYVGGAELRAKKKGKNGRLTIRGGKGFQPVLRGPVGGPMLTLVNVDLKLSDLHFASGEGFRVRDGSVLVQRCTFTWLKRGGGFGVRIVNLRGEDNPLSVIINQCLLRGEESEGCGLEARGASISISLNESACVRIWFGMVVYLDEKQSLAIRQATLITRFLSLRARNPSSWPENAFSFRMEHTLFDAFAGGGYLAHLELPNDYRPSTLSECQQIFGHAIREVGGQHNIGSFWNSAWRVGGNESFGVLPDGFCDQHEIVYGKRIEEARELTHKKSDFDGAGRVLAAVEPVDLLATPAASLPTNGVERIRYGVDTTKLPIPPVLTLKEYDPDILGFHEAEQFKILRKSEEFPVERESLEEKPLWTIDERHLAGYATKAGQWVDLSFPIPRAGRYRVRAHLTRGPEFGIVRILLHGRRAGTDVDLGGTELAPLQVDLGEFDFPAGNAVLRIETARSSSQSPKPGFRFGIDCLILRRVQPQ